MKHHHLFYFVALLLVLLVVSAISLLWANFRVFDHDIVWQLRFPRIILAASVGAGLAVSGLILQALFSNPLCEPYTLGISSGASLGAIVGVSLGITVAPGGVVISAFAGALLFTLFLFLVSFRQQFGITFLLLSGVMMGFLGSSLVALWMAMTDPAGMQGVLFWLLGDFSRAQIQSSLLALSAIGALTIVSWFHWRALDVVVLGDDASRALGLSTFVLRRRLLVLTSLVVAFCVSTSGMIGFVGLLVPHLARRLFGFSHLRALPAAALMGAVAMVASDFFARVLLSPTEIPVGVMTSILGAPLFLWVLLKSREART